MSLNDAAVVTIVQDKAECRLNVEPITQQVQGREDPSELTCLPPAVNSKGPGNLLKENPVEVSSDAGSSEKVGTHKKSAVSKEPRGSYTPNFRRPLLGKQMTNWFYASTKSDIHEKQLILGEMVNNMDVPSSLTEALSLGLTQDQIG